MSSKVLPVPALERGLRVLVLLQEKGPLSLERIAEFSKIPKSSALRLLRTLEEINYVRRDQHTKHFHSQAKLVAHST